MNECFCWNAGNATLQFSSARRTLPFLTREFPVPTIQQVHDAQALGLNARFRFYRYGPGDYFLPHTDGSWPGSRVRDGQLVCAPSCV